MDVFSLSLTETDIISIRSALRLWGKSIQIIEGYDNVQINKHFELWARFVQTDWRDWDISEHDHDIGSRYWIQIAVDYSTSQTRNILEKVVQPIDEIFKVTGVMEMDASQGEAYLRAERVVGIV